MMLEISDFICKDPSIAQLVLYIASTALLRYEVVWGHIDVLVVAVRLSMYNVRGER